MKLRFAEEKDIDQLIKMRWDFTIEHDESKKNASFQTSIGYYKENGYGHCVEAMEYFPS